MKVEYILTAELRVILKQPFGILIEGSSDETMAKLRSQVGREKPPMVIAVGDVVSKNLHEYTLHPQVSIIDHVSLRDQKTLPPEAHGEKTVHVKNPPGVITREAIDAIKKATVEGSHTHIVVAGEEDLLTLIAVMHAPINSLIIYGQPHSGIVIVKVTSEKKGEVRGYLKAMKI
jgi:GTP-dependent dephospho-CoA kinase